MDIRSVDSTIPPAATGGPVVPQEVRVEQQQLIKAVKAVNSEQLFGENSELTFVLDRETRRPLLRLVDVRTKEVIRQIPAEYVIRMAEQLHAYAGA
jgi:flagellar protein FlaG